MRPGCDVYRQAGKLGDHQRRCRNGEQFCVVTRESAALSGSLTGGGWSPGQAMTVFSETSVLPRVALEYGQTWWTASTSA
ncbi:hypothetical protein Kisp02_57470 [Kineosporia sp. NBRC 101731]|nr:hypothetical protein Kisp02_57470 [Kineosporia sp. NBRC 101731]